MTCVVEPFDQAYEAKPVGPVSVAPVAVQFDVTTVGLTTASIVAVTGVRLLSHVPLLMATWYVVVAKITGVVKVLFPEPRSVPPVALAYQRYSPGRPPEAESVIATGMQLEAPLVVGGEGGVFIVAVTAVRVALSQPSFMDT